MLETIIITAFGVTNTIRFIAYLPQIAAIARDPNGATAVSFITWGIWTSANVTTAAYAAVIVKDPALFLVSSSNTFFCVVVIVLTIVKRVRHARRGCGRSQREPNVSDSEVEGHA